MSRDRTSKRTAGRDASRRGDVPTRATLAMLAVVSSVASVLAVVSPFASGDRAWAQIVTAILIVATVLYALAVRRGIAVPGVTPVAAGVLAGLAALHWAAHDDTTPFQQLYVLPGLLVAAFAGARQTAATFAAITLAELGPAFGADADAAAQSVAVTHVTVLAGLLTLAHLWARGGRRREGALAAERRLAEREVLRDPLTGLPNRRAFERELEFATRRGDVVAVALLDLNGFKAINDRFGHLEGDRKLKDVAAAIRRALRAEDLACRWAGDEFALLLPGVSTEQAAETARRVDAHVRSSCRDPDGLPMSLKWGVAALPIGGAATDLMREADAQLVRATSRRRPVR